LAWHIRLEMQHRREMWRDIVQSLTPAEQEMDARQLASRLVFLARHRGPARHHVTVLRNRLQSWPGNTDGRRHLVLLAGELTAVIEAAERE